MRDELARARAEARADLRRARSGVILLAAASALFIVALSMFDLAVVLAIGGTVGSALVIAFIVVAEVIVLGYLGYRRLPQALLGKGRDVGGSKRA